MKDGKFETQAEIFKALLDGNKIKFSQWSELYNKFVYLKDGVLTNDRGFADYSSFSETEKWSIYEEPKPKKKVTLYRYTYFCHRRDIYLQSFWVSESWEEHNSYSETLLLTESKEIEVDDDN